MTKEKQNNIINEWFLINLLHIIILAPVAIYIGVMKNNSISEIVILMITMFLFGIWYHSSKLLKISKINIISISHIIFGIIGTIYLMMSNRPLWFYYSMLIAGFYSGIKHSYHIIKSYNKN